VELGMVRSALESVNVFTSWLARTLLPTGMRFDSSLVTNDSWCNGNTTVFGTVIQSPCESTNLKLNKMSKTKFNGFEKYFIQTALKHAIEEAEKDVLAAEANGKRSIYAPGYFTMVGKEIIDKVNSMTLKKYQD
jgi:hypothetical protein